MRCALIRVHLSILNGMYLCGRSYDEVSTEHPSISRGTVYRTLNRLDETG